MAGEARRRKASGAAVPLDPGALALDPVRVEAMFNEYERQLRVLRCELLQVTADNAQLQRQIAALQKSAVAES